MSPEEFFHGEAESVLVQRAVAGDRLALSELLLAGYDDLRRHVVHLLARDSHEPNSADDILQQTFVRAALAVHRFEHRTGVSFRAWLQTIAGNLVRDAQKRHRRERRVIRSADVAPGLGNSSSRHAARVDQFAGNTTSPSMRVHRRDSMQRMRAAMEALPEDQREVIQRHYLQHQSFDQIAVAMHRTKDAVRGISHRARQNLRSMLGHSSRFFSN
jgi:RNA polymerase sigma factor (sigma-70 family)